ncbi:MAG: hypothetical protein M3Q07_27030, partial [Pseudobdellovibrionaceae bacterium]|nr:hypothetical protein [Pseudobdellovibrionaceae bacterium]
MKKSLSILSIGFGLLSCGDGHAEEPSSLELQTEQTICQLAWEQNEEQMDPEDRLGNPFPMLNHPHQNWQFKIAANGHTLHLMPAEKLQFQVELDPDQTISGQVKIVDCEVPTAWKILDSRLRVTFDPKLGNSRQITMINGKPFGSETKG